ncbi:CynX/NimT family MFS transporter [Ammoniphilus resinae]
MTEKKNSLNIILIIGVVLIASNLRAPITSIGPIVGIIAADTGFSNALTGLLTTLSLLSFAAFSFFIPKISFRYGIEYTLMAGLAVLTIGIILRSVNSIFTLFFGTIILGLAIAIGNVLLPSLIKREFPNNIGFMTGLYSVSMSIWAAIASGLSVPLVLSFGLGWRAALMCWAIPSVIAFVFFLPQMSSSNPLSRRTYSPSGYLWRSKLAWQITLFMGLQSLGFYSIISWLPEILYNQGLETNFAGWLLSYMQIVSIPLTFIVPLIAGRLSNQRVIVLIIFLFFLIGYFGLLYGSTFFLTLWITLIGIGQGASISLALLFMGLRTTNTQQSSELSGMAQSIGYLIAAGGPVFFGFLHDLTQSWTTTILILIATTIIQLIVGLGAGGNKKISIEEKAKVETI